MATWREILADRMPAELAEGIDLYAGQMELMRQGKLDERVFAEARLRRGVYGQRYDNGQRHDGIRTQTLDYPQALIKGVDTLWDAPGMQRVKIPFGGVTPEQMDALAQLADEYADGILHVTTRQDFQLHFVHIEDTPDLLRRLAAVGITTQEACGNSVRNVTACPLAGVCRTELFDVTPYAQALARFLLGHDDIQDFGRKFKTAFSGCADEGCGLVMLNDLGFVARVKELDGRQQRGFAVYVGGGLGAVPQQARLLSEFVPEEEILPIAQAIARVFARLGEKRNHNRARIKFLVAQLGIEEFRRLVKEERKTLPHDERWTAYLHALPLYQEIPRRSPIFLEDRSGPEGFDAWYATNVYRQRRAQGAPAPGRGYATVTVNLPLGDISAAQMWQLADLARKYVGDHVRTTVEQNIVLRWVAEADLPALHSELKAIGLGAPGAGTIVDITACPGTDTCKLGIASSRGLAAELQNRWAAKNGSLPDAVKELRIKISGCFNSCGQYHIADIGFFGNSRRSGNYKVPHFQVVLGGQWKGNAASYGLAVGAVPSKAVPEVVDAIASRYAAERQPDESFQEWLARLGKQEVRAMLEPFMRLPAHEVEPEFFSDWGDPREFTLDDIGVGECAGEVVSLFSMEIAKAESAAFEAQVALERQDYVRADQLAYGAMLLAAKALVRTQFLDVGDNPDQIVAEFRTRFYDTELFFDRYVKGKFAQFLFARHEKPNPNPDPVSTHQLIEEAVLFIEAAHSCEAETQRTALGVKR